MDTQQATLLRFHDGNCVDRTLLCQPEVTLIAVTAYVRDNFKAPVHNLTMTGCAADLSLRDVNGQPRPKGIVLPMIIDLTGGF